MNYIVPLTTGELLAFALVCASVGVALGLVVAGWLAMRDPTSERPGTNGSAPHAKPPAPPNPPHLTVHERRRFRS